MPATRAWTAVAVTLLTASALMLALDFDGDGLATATELGAGTRFLDADSDDDGLRDDVERRMGLSPTRADHDGDGLVDGLEVRLGSDPFKADTDGDGVPDGDERNPACIRAPDCDLDGLPDGDEAPGYDPLDPDSYDVGLLDGVVRAFETAGQPPGRDADADGIPDAWEDTAGLIDWGPFSPTAGRRDLLVEFLRVRGPESGRFGLDMRPAYEAVAAFFARESDIHLQWIETVVSRPAEHRPGFLDTDDLGYYAGVLAQGKGSTNPYVTSIVLNPQQEQEDLAGDILGAAFLRSMIATVDYGAHVVVHLEEASSSGISLSGGTLDLRPVLESHIIGARPEQIQQLRSGEGVVNLGGDADSVWMVTRQRNPDASTTTFRWDWHPEWFAWGPNITTSGGRYLQLRAVGATVDHAGLASTIAHELGHTLGLCHAHEPSCYGDFEAQDISAAAISSSTMSYSAPDDALHFLGSEWRQVSAYLACPPQQPIQILASGGGAAEFFHAKYETSFSVATDLRSCSDLEPLERTLEPGGPTQALGAEGGGLLAAYWLAAGAVAAAAAVLSRRF